MFKPISLYIGLRYTRAKKRNQFVSFIALTSMLGIALGVTVLITVLSVMNGFDHEIGTVSDVGHGSEEDRAGGNGHEVVRMVNEKASHVLRIRQINTLQTESGRKKVKIRRSVVK